MTHPDPPASVASSPAESERRARAALAFYGPLSEARDPARRVGWESAAIQRVRLEALARAIGPLSKRTSVLDAGCGEGALLPILRRRGFGGTYRGEDVLAAPITRAAHDDPKASFVVADSFSGGPSAAAVVCSGALNTESGAASHDAEVAHALGALWERCTEILAIDLAVFDRHAPGVGLARADLSRAFAHARTLTPIVAVREDLVPGEAVLTLARSRAAGLLWTGADPLDRVEVLLMAGEAREALARLDSLDAALGAGALRDAPTPETPAETPTPKTPAETPTPKTPAETPTPETPAETPTPETPAETPTLDPAVALPARVALLRGLALGALARPVEALDALVLAASHEPIAARARLAQAPLLWRLGKKAQAERVLTELAAHDDEARAHLASLLAARGDKARAAQVASAIEDAWIRREVLAALTSPPR